MKYLIIIITIFFSKPSFCQSLDTVAVNLTLRAGDWAFIAGSLGADDSISIVQFRRLRDTVRLANPGTFNTNVRMNAIPGITIYSIYTTVKGLPVTLYEQIGTNISTQIKAISNTTLQNFITAYDNQAASLYLARRTRGKNLLLDN